MLFGFVQSATLLRPIGIAGAAYKFLDGTDPRRVSDGSSRSYRTGGGHHNRRFALLQFEIIPFVIHRLQREIQGTRQNSGSQFRIHQFRFAVLLDTATPNQEEIVMLKSELVDYKF
jgi:hypothetical protein